MNRKELIKALNSVKGCLESKHFIPIMTNFCFEKGNVFAFNGEQGIVVSFDHNLSGGVHGDTFLKILNSFSADDVSLTQKGTDLEVKCGRSTTTLSMSPESNFARHNGVKTSEVLAEVQLDGSFFSGLEKCLSSVCKNPAVLNQYGVSLFNDADSCYLFSTDNKRISEFFFNSLGEKEFKVLLPEKFCKLAIALFKDTEEGVFLEIRNNYAEIQGNGITLFTALIENVQFLNYPEYVNKYPTRSFQEVPADLKDSAERAAALSSKSVHLSVSENYIKLDTKGDIGNVSDTVECAIAFPEELSFPMEVSYFKDTLKSVKEFTLVKHTDSSEVVLIGKNGDYSTYLLQLTGE